jgi:hypothetical protein
MQRPLSEEYPAMEARLSFFTLRDPPFGDAQKSVAEPSVAQIAPTVVSSCCPETSNLSPGLIFGHPDCLAAVESTGTNEKRPDAGPQRLPAGRYPGPKRQE